MTVPEHPAVKEMRENMEKSVVHDYKQHLNKHRQERLNKVLNETSVNWYELNQEIFAELPWCCSEIPYYTAIEMAKKETELLKTIKELKLPSEIIRIIGQHWSTPATLF